MCSLSGLTRFFFSIVIVMSVGGLAVAQRSKSSTDDSDFGPVMSAYLGYLSNEQEVVDDRASRREITPAYYRRNSNRIHALREMAVHIVHQSGNDYVPELEAVTSEEFGTLFEHPPRPATFRQNEILANKFRFLGVVHSGEAFYLFARLDPYEQADLMQRRGKESASAAVGNGGASGQRVGQTGSRPRRAVPK